MKKLTLQWRITILSAIVLAIASAALTAAAIINAENSFMILVEQSTAPQPTLLTDAPVPSGTALPGQPSTPAQLARKSFGLWSILVCGIFTVLGTGAIYFVTGKALQPLRSLSKAVEHIDEQTLSQRLPEAVTHDELGVLTCRFNEMLARLDDAFLRQKRFTANAAHELKTPLATLKTGIQVLSSEPNATLADYKEHTKRTLICVDRLTGIVDDLLLLASVGERAVTEKEEVYLEPLFEAIENELSPLLKQREIACIVNCGELAVYGNTAFLYRAFFNLVENACKYGYPGGHIWIDGKQEKGFVSICVKDDGPGIGTEHLPYIFDAFYRIDKSRSREIGGSGLGLSLVKTMLEAEGGTITAESDGSGGSCFTAMLPISL